MKCRIKLLQKYSANELNKCTVYNSVKIISSLMSGKHQLSSKSQGHLDLDTDAKFSLKVLERVE